METVQIQPTGVLKKPSLLRQIVDEVDMLDDEGKEDLLRKIKIAKLLNLAKIADESMEGKWNKMSEDEIADMVSINRKKWYEESISH